MGQSKKVSEEKWRQIKKSRAYWRIQIDDRTEQSTCARTYKKKILNLDSKRKREKHELNGIVFDRYSPKQRFDTLSMEVKAKGYWAPMALDTMAGNIRKMPE